MEAPQRDAAMVFMMNWPEPYESLPVLKFTGMG